MFSPIIERVKTWRIGKRNKDSQELRVLLEKDSFERFERLRNKMTAFDNSELIASALKCLEDKTERIIKRQIMKSIRTLKNEGYSHQQIAKYLNKKRVPLLANMDKWESSTVSSLLEKEEKEFILSVSKDSQHRNHQSRTF